MRAAAQRRHRAGTTAELARHGVLRARLSPGEDGFPRQALVVRDATGLLRAFLNQCRHLPIPLGPLRAAARRPAAASRDDLLDDAGRHLVCLTHGAMYRVEDGLCVAGPCEGDRLLVLRVSQEGDEIWVEDAR